MMTADDAERWDARYEGRSVPSASRPDALTDDLDALLPRTGRALDVACGAGAESVWLAERGLSVTAVDVSSKAADLTLAASRRAGVDGRVEVTIHDLDHGLPASPAPFDVIVCQRFRHPDLYASFVDRLSDGGIAIVTVLSETGVDAPGPFHAPSGELAAAFARPDCVVLRHAEGDGHESIVVQRNVD